MNTVHLLRAIGQLEEPRILWKLEFFLRAFVACSDAWQRTGHNSRLRVQNLDTWPTTTSSPFKFSPPLNTLLRRPPLEAPAQEVQTPSDKLLSKAQSGLFQEFAFATSAYSVDKHSDGPLTLPDHLPSVHPRTRVLQQASKAATSTLYLPTVGGACPF